MTWTTFHHRGDVLRAVTATADERRDGLLPMDVDGVLETFGDELSLLGALQLRWHTRLSGQIERELLQRPLDLEAAVIAAWHAAADELPGTRAILDHYREEPRDEQMAFVMATSEAKERVLLAAMAGRAGVDTAATATAGQALEERARQSWAPTTTPAEVTGHRGPGLLGRIRAYVAA
ncbi:hypothetical protein [Nocardioides cynanchi]|uniref:hypothetical protein n=1 Tax=Nocardioides cynanchi TaxID=2558918 RepID=UPI001243BD9D|nr:hypothetical protein [Nocardioides cynanchi]